jgi:peptidoglycan endopeptidase LytF
MSRKDTIIVAVLVNAGLLIVLFASALKSHSNNSEEFVANPAPVFKEVSDFAVKKEPAPVIGDEVDAALNQFAQNAMPPQTPVMQTPSLMPPAETVVTNFADDLKAIALPETPAAHTLVAPIVPQNQSAPEFTEVKVKKGDVLEKIARHHHTSVAEIMKANKLTSTNLRIGQVLKIPNKTIKKAEPSTIVYAPHSAASDTDAKYYIVKKGDNPWTIAVKNHLKVEDLLRLNNMSEDQARRLKPGDKIRIQ